MIGAPGPRPSQSPPGPRRWRFADVSGRAVGAPPRAGSHSRGGVAGAGAPLAPARGPPRSPGWRYICGAGVGHRSGGCAAEAEAAVAAGTGRADVAPREVRAPTRAPSPSPAGLDGAVAGVRRGLSRRARACARGTRRPCEEPPVLRAQSARRRPGPRGRSGAGRGRGRPGAGPLRGAWGRVCNQGFAQRWECGCARTGRGA